MDKIYVAKQVGTFKEEKHEFIDPQELYVAPGMSVKRLLKEHQQQQIEIANLKKMVANIVATIEKI